MRPALAIVLLAVAAFSAGATTLEKLSVQEMAQKSTAVVRARATVAGAVQRGSMIYTVYRLQVSEVLKGAAPAEVFVPGGTYGRYRQSIAGSPVLEPGVDYVLFLWASPRGLVQVIGLSQGVFQVKTTSGGEALLVRDKVEAQFVDRLGRAVEDNGVKLSLASLRQLLAGAAARKEAQ
jgi:hypothetical protein